MTAEGNLHGHQSALAQSLTWITRLVLRVPLAVVVLSITVALLSVGWTFCHLGFRTSRLDLLNPNSVYNKLWIDYTNEFGDEDDAVVVVEGAGRDDVIPVLEQLSSALSREDKHFHAILHEINLTKIRAKGLHYLSLDELRCLEQFYIRIDPILAGNWGLLNTGRMVEDIHRRLSGADPRVRASAEAELSGLVASLSTSLAERGRYRSPWRRMSDSVATISQIDSEYLLANEGRLGFVLLRLAGGQDRFARGGEAIGQLRSLIKQVQAQHPHVQIGLTGLPVMEHDEMSTSQCDMLYAALISLTGVACLFIAGFGGLRHPFMTVAALLLALAWSFGLVTVVVGHLNILSMSFAVILIGLGIDFGIHYVARYLQLRSANLRCKDALIQTAHHVGPGVLTGGVTTAIAFLSAGLTEFTGIAELGIIAGSGILLCVVAALLALPAMIYLSDRYAPRVSLPEPIQVGRFIALFVRFPFLTLLATLAICLSVAPGMHKLRYDHNLLNLQPVGLESVQLERKLLAETDQSIWFALSMAESRQEILERKQSFLKLPSVDRTEEAASFFPADDQEKRTIIARLQQRLGALAERPPLIPETPPDKLGQQLASVHRLIVDTDPRSRTSQRHIAEIQDLLRRTPLADCFARLSEFQQRMARDLLSRMHTLRSMANPEPPQLSDLPEGFVTRFVGKSNRFLLKIYSRADIWDMDALEQFVTDVKRIDPQATGKPLQTYYASRQMQLSYVQAALYSLVAVVVVLWLDFRHIGYVLLTLMPVGSGMFMLFGVMGLLDISLNPANMIVLPLILGIGIDDGVHVVHDFRNQNGPYVLSNSTASAVLLTSLTTMIGFGSLMIAGHLGLQSLGRVLTIGVNCCLLTSLVMLPALLTWIARGRRDAVEKNEPKQDERSHGDVSWKVAGGLHSP